MFKWRIWTLVISCLSACCTFATADDFEGSQWIWGDDAQLAGVVYMGTRIDLPENSTVRSARLLITADNLFDLYLNEAGVGESESNNSAWMHPHQFDVTRLLVPGRNRLVVQAVNTLDGPAGLLVKLTVDLADGRQIVVVSDGNWKWSDRPGDKWQGVDVEERHWSSVQVLGNFGSAPWHRPGAAGPIEAAGNSTGAVSQVARNLTASTSRASWVDPPSDYAWPAGVVFVGDDCSLYPQSGSGALSSLNVTMFTARRSRAFPEHDLPSPVKVGHKLYRQSPARPDVKPTLLLDAGGGAVGSPSVSYDGSTIYFSMASEGESFYHLYRMPAAGGEPVQLTTGPFHDIDPVELPDGNIAFVSTRIGRFEEYHNTPSRALFVMNPDGGDIRSLTNTIAFDNEPEVMADGRLIFIRSDNFFDRGKVETRLQAIHPDGTHGYTEFGLDNAPEYGGRLRAFYCGSPAPMPDGRVAFVSQTGITIARPGDRLGDWRNVNLPAGDVAAVPDGRLILTLARSKHQYDKIAALDEQGRMVLLYDAGGASLHSPVYLGARARPRALSRTMQPGRDDKLEATGVLFCQNVRFTPHTTAGWRHVRAIRVLAGIGLTMRSSHSYIVHAGSRVVELGTVPLAPDGSFAVEVPADTPIALQAVDAEGRSELNEMSWIYVRPGETRGCSGCHMSRQSAPVCVNSTDLLATRTSPLRLLGKGQPHQFRGNNAAVTGLMEMQFDRYREVAGINRFNDEAEVSGRNEHVQRVMVQLRGDEPDLKLSAAQRAAIFHDAAAAPALADCLTDPKQEVRVAAAMALAACGTRESVQPLLRALNDREPLVAQAAAVALENLSGHREAFNAFVSHEDRGVQASAWVQWFADHSWDRIEHQLVDRLADADRDEVRRAAVALGHVGRDAARAALRELVDRQRRHNPLPAWRTNHKGDGARFNAQSPVNPRPLQAAVRSLGYLGDVAALAMLTEILTENADPETGNLFLAEAAAQAIGRIATPQAESALIQAFKRLKSYPLLSRWYGDHDALIACHASPVHVYIIEALDAMGSTQGSQIAAELIRSVPTDPDRALLSELDDVERLTGRMLRRGGMQTAVVETCLALLGDAQATRDQELEKAIGDVHGAWAGRPDPQIRAAQILSLTCSDTGYEPRVRAAFDRYRATTSNIPRVFDEGIPVVNRLPTRHWVCFYMARTLGNLGSTQSVDSLLAALQSPSEAATGHPDPLGPGVLFLHNDLTPCWRAASAWALGRIGDSRAAPTLLKIIADLTNATDTRHAAAEAIGRIGNPSVLAAARKLAAEYPEVSTRQALLKSCTRLANVSSPSQ